MTIPNTSMNTHRKFGRSSLGGMGWRATASSRPGRFQTRGDIQARSNFRASPWLRTIKCPACGDEHVRPCTRLDEYGRVWTDNSCETCGHPLSLKEIGFMRSTERRIMKSLVTLLALILVAGFSAATPKNQVACDKAGMNWDATATAPNAKCSSAFA